MILEQNFITFFASYKRYFDFLKLIWGSSRYLTVLNVVLRLYKSIVPFLALYIGRIIFDSVLHLINNPGGDSFFVMSLVVIEFVLVAVSSIAAKEIILINILLADKFSIEMNVRLMELARDLDVSFFEDAGNQALIERVQGQISKGPGLLNSILDQIQHSLTIISLLIGIIAINGWYFFFFIFPAWLLFKNENVFYERKYSLMLGWSTQQRAINYYRNRLVLYDSLKEIRVFNLYDFFIDRFRTISWGFFEESRANARKRAFWSKIFAFFSILVNYVIYFYLVNEAIEGELTLGELTFLVGSLERTTSSLERILEKLSLIKEESLYLEDFFLFFNTVRIPGPDGTSSVPDIVEEGIVFEDVWFKYPGSNDWVFNGLSISILPGERWGVLGENGSGKSTFVKLLLRFYRPTRGRIFLDGKCIDDYSLESYYRAIGVHYQDFCRYFMECNINISLGDLNTLKDAEKIRRAASRSRADEFIKKFPNGYDQVLGKHFVGGVEVSGGQWQRIALSRMFLKEHTILVLDEPFSAMDMVSEISVSNELIATHNENRIVILISHKLSTLKRMDKIMILDRGIVSELGTHGELMNRRGKYYHLYVIQTMDS